MAQIKSLNLKFKTQKTKNSAKTNKFKSFNEGEVASSANKYVAQMRSILSKAYVKLKKVRKEKNIDKLDCINSSVMTIKGHVRRSEDNNVAISEAIAKSNLSKARVLLNKIYSSFNEVKQAEIAMKACDSGDIVQYNSPPSIKLTEKPNLVIENDYIEKEEDPMSISFKESEDSNSNNTQVELEPVQASPYF